MRLTAAVLLLATASHLACFAQNRPPSVRKDTPKKALGNVTGTAYCADTNMPARRAGIILVPANGEDTRRMLAATTDLDGHFAVNKVPEGTYYVSTLLAGYLNPLSSSKSNQLSSLPEEERKELESHVTKVTVEPEQTASVSIRLERAAEIDGTVLYDDGSPAIGLRIQLRQKSPSTQEPQERHTYSGFSEYADQDARVTDDRGRFRLLGLAPGEYLVSVNVPTVFSDGTVRSNLIDMALQSSPIGSLILYYGDSPRASKATPIKIEGGETFSGAEITIPLQKLHTVRGHVLLKRTGQPPPTAVLRLLYADTHEPARVAQAVNGEFTISYVTEDSYVLQAVAKSEHVPDFDDGDGNAQLGIFIGGMALDDSLELDDEDKQKLDEAGEVTLMVQGNMDAVTLEVPDPSAAKPTIAPGNASENSLGASTPGTSSTAPQP